MTVQASASKADKTVKINFMSCSDNCNMLMVHGGNEKTGLVASQLIYNV